MTTMSVALLAVVAVLLCLLFRLLNVGSQPQRPYLLCRDAKFLDAALKASPRLHEPYIPTRLWGFSGHVQTMLHSIVGRVRCPWPLGERCFLTQDDGATLTYDLYQPIEAHDTQGDYTLAVCPGICNSSESIYVRTFVHHAQRRGFRCAVLNHIGTLNSVPLTSPRIFTYGHTDDYALMLSHLMEQYPSTKLIAVGFSMGGNIVTKFVGERKKLHESLIGAISVCQGYNALRAMDYLLQWQNFRRFYLYVMTENMKRTIAHHRSILLSDDIKHRGQINEREVFSAATLPELDDAYTRRVCGFASVSDFYRWQSCETYMEDVSIPMVFINALDDPIVPEPLLEPVRTFAATNPATLYVEPAHGGHLGFYEGGLLYPNPVTWLDRTLVDLANAILAYSVVTGGGDDRMSSVMS